MRPTLRELTALFARAGNFTLGGGIPTIAVLERELVQRRGWLTRSQFDLCFALMRLTPGTNMLAFCAAAAWLIRGWPAAMLAVLVVTAPSGAMAVAITEVLELEAQSAAAAAAIGGALAAAVGLMASAAWAIFRPYANRQDMIPAVLLVAGSAVLSLGLGWNPVLVLGVAAIAGALWR